MTTLLAHEWLAPAGGSENVFEELSALIPGARRVCLWNDAHERFSGQIEQTWLAGSRLRRSKALAYPFLSSAWRRVDLAGVDRVVVSTHASSHYLASRAAGAGIASFAYVHTPPRYIWAPEADERGRSIPVRAGRHVFRSLDRRRTAPTVSFAANSEFVRERVRAAWGVDARVIHPPVDVEAIQAVDDWRARVDVDDERRRLDALPEMFVLAASRLVEYKRLEVAIDVGESLGLPVVIAGAGPSEARLRRLAQDRSVPVVFFGRASTPALYALYQNATLFVFMAIEDFGIMPVEAMATGTPVLVNACGGARESVCVTGGGAVLAEPWSAAGLKIASEDAIARPRDRTADRARLFSATRFRERVGEWLGAHG